MGMNNDTIQTAFGFAALHGQEKVRPYAEGDIVVKHSGRRYVVTTVSDNNAGAVLCCIALDNGAECVVLEREVAYRTNVA